MEKPLISRGFFWSFGRWSAGNHTFRGPIYGRDLPVNAEKGSVYGADQNGRVGGKGCEVTKPTYI
jgi:hypothetical protein